MQKSISFPKGLTTSPSNLLSDDTDLVESVNMLFRAGEMHPIQAPVKIGAFTNDKEELRFVHNIDGYVNYITHDGLSLRIYNYADAELKLIFKEDIRGLFAIDAVHSTLVLSTAKGILYIHFIAGTYTLLGELPKPSVTFCLEAAQTYNNDNTYTPPTLVDYTRAAECKAYYSTEGKLCQFEEISGITESGYHLQVSSVSNSSTDDSNTQTYIGYGVIPSKQADFNDAVQGILAHGMNNVKKNRAFAFPFFVRFALRMYDGTYTRISNPVLCLPSIHYNGFLKSKAVKLGGRLGSSEMQFNVTNQKSGYFIPWLSDAALYFKCSIPDIDKWKDIIKDFVVFTSDEVLPFTMDGGWKFCQPSSLIKEILNNSMEKRDIITLDYIKDLYFNSTEEWTYDLSSSGSFGDKKNYYTKGPLTSLIVAEKRKSEEDIKKELLKKSVFYKLFEVKANSPLLDGKTYNNSQELIEDGVVENLTEQQQLGVDDYYGWTTLRPGKMFTYNSRINLINVRRLPFSGFSQFVAFKPESPDARSLDFYTRIQSSSMEACVKSTVRTIPEALRMWFSYPDPNAKEVIIVADNSNILSLSLQQHPRLNAAYFMGNWPPSFKPRFTTGETPSLNYNSELLTSQIFTSVVNNPFVFQASGDNTVGTGSILGIAANTEPISQGQFGQYPLLVFTTEGIYGMSVNSEGLYSASYPMSREVCNNPASITPTGSLVFFTSAKGLMAVSGGNVSCVSTQLQGRNPSPQFLTLGDGNFIKFLSGSFLAYDYRDSLLHIINPTKKYEYVYSIPDGTFAKAKLSDWVLTTANAYPDSLIQLIDGTVLSLNSKPDINDDTTLYSGTFTTRPLKLGSSLQLKTIHQILHLFDTANGKIALRIYGSNDCRNWCELHSLHGKPWKYYTLSYKLSNMLATDAFAGTVVDFQPLFTKKMR